jgi:hypothetical protein
MQKRKGNILMSALILTAIFAVLAVGFMALSYKGAADAQALSVAQLSTVPTPAAGTAGTPTGGTPVTTTITLSTSNKFLGTAITGVNLQYRQVGVKAWTTTVSPGSITASQGQVYEIGVAAENATDYGIGTPTATLGTVVNNPDSTKATVLYTVPYATTATIDFALAPVATVASLTFFTNNPDGNGANANGTAYQALAATEKDMPFTISGISQTSYGSLQAGRYSNLLVCNVNRTSIPNPLKLLNSDGSETNLRASLVPQNTYTGTNGTYSWYFPVIEGGASYSYKLAVIPSTVAANAPSAGANGEGANVKCELYDSGSYWDASTGSNNIYYGVQDELSNDVVGATTRMQMSFAFARTSTGG